MKLPVVISLRNDLPICAIPNGRLLARELQDVLEVDEDALGGLRAQVGDRAGVLDRADGRLEHEVELARVGEVAVGTLARASSTASGRTGAWSM